MYKRANTTTGSISYNTNHAVSELLFAEDTCTCKSVQTQTTGSIPYNTNSVVSKLLLLLFCSSYACAFHTSQ